MQNHSVLKQQQAQVDFVEKQLGNFKQFIISLGSKLRDVPLSHDAPASIPEDMRQLGGSGWVNTMKAVSTPRLSTSDSPGQRDPNSAATTLVLEQRIASPDVTVVTKPSTDGENHAGPMCCLCVLSMCNRCISSNIRDGRRSVQPCHATTASVTSHPNAEEYEVTSEYLGISPTMCVKTYLITGVSIPVACVASSALTHR